MLPACGERVAAVSTRTVWVLVGLVVAFVLALGSALVAYAGASAEARLLDEQGKAKDREIVILVVQRDQAVATSDRLIAEQDSAQAADTASVNEAAVVSDATASTTARALAEAREAARGLPVVEAALARAEAALAASEGARQEERATSAAALFSSQMRERTLGRQLLTERTASADVEQGLREALVLERQESAAWQRAAVPGALTQLWRQGRAALVVGALVLALK